MFVLLENLVSQPECCCVQLLLVSQCLIDNWIFDQMLGRDLV